MFKLVKKLAVGASVAALLGTFVFGRDVFSYVRTSASSVRDAVRAEVPVEFEIRRAEQMVGEIVPEIERCMHVIAEQQYDIEQRTESLQKQELALSDQKAAILALRSDLGSGKQSFVYASRSYSSNDVKQDLARRFERFKTSEQTLERDRDVLSARMAALAANEDKLDNMLSAKQDLVVKLENLEARLNAVQAREAISDIKIDDSQLSRAKELISRLDHMVGTREKKLDNEGRYTGMIPVEAEADATKNVENVVEDIDSYFESSDGLPTSPTGINSASL
ncbi:hypothetical protein [Stratiformator vulcanicus]|uniref:Chromosome partition protein Smc n=1 Tax=Stratiformator vulcanicus TaxID=2527980 RepID=A0A517QZJ0_9PLAN|nr:hypothetical protein [Stratiformator vulcanicus]QDT37051.1 hypothetical protein Pan189_14170 [Stratiformator vulcanicus]